MQFFLCIIHWLGGFVMISTEWGEPNAFLKGFNPQDVADGMYNKVTTLGMT